MRGAPNQARPIRASLTTGSVGRHLLRLSLPMVLGIVSIMAFNMMDTYFVSRLGAVDLAALGFVLPVVMLLGSLALGLGIGVTSVVSRAIGANDTARVKQLTTHSLLFSVTLVALLSVAGLLTIDPLFTLLGADAETLVKIEQYMSVWYLGTAFVVVPMVGNGAIRATGDTRTPAVVMVLAGVANLILDPILIFGLGPIPPMGLEGAAIATVAARALTLVVALVVLITREHMVTFEGLGVRRVLSSWGSLLSVGGPAALSNMAVPMSMAVLTSFVASYGQTGVAGFAVGSRVIMMMMIPSIAVASGLSPLVGQNWGARRYERVALTIRLGGLFVVFAGIAGWVVSMQLAGHIAAIFSRERPVTMVIEAVLVIAPMSLAPFGFFRVTASSLNAAGHSVSAALLNLLRAPVFLIFFGWLGSEIWGLAGVFVGMGVTNLCAGLAAWAVGWRLRNPVAAAAVDDGHIAPNAAGDSRPTPSTSG